MPAGDVNFTLEAVDGAPVVTRLEKGDVPPVMYTAKAPELDALEAGQLDVNVAFMQGKVKAAGDMQQILATLKALKR